MSDTLCLILSFTLDLFKQMGHYNIPKIQILPEADLFGLIHIYWPAKQVDNNFWSLCCVHVLMGLDT